MARGNRKKVGERVIFVTDENGYDEYCSVEMTEYEGSNEITFSAHCGEVMSSEELDRRVEDHWDGVDLEDEYGYLADEQGIEGPKEREEWLETLARQLKEDYSPYEVYQWERDQVFTIHSAGQMKDEVCDKKKVAKGAHDELDTVCKGWDKYHLATHMGKKNPTKKEKDRIKKAFLRFPTFEDVDKKLGGK